MRGTMVVFQQKRVELRDPLESSNQLRTNTLLEIESRLNHVICLVGHFEHEILFLQIENLKSESHI